MKVQDWRRLIRPLLPDGWALVGDTAYHQPVRWVLRGVLGESSALSPRGVYVWRIQLPLVLPETVMVLDWSERYGGPSQIWDIEDPLLVGALRDVISRVASDARADRLVVEPLQGSENVQMMETRAYSLFLDGNHSGALEVLRRLQRYEDDDVRPFVLEMKARVRRMASLLEAGERSEFSAILRSWRKTWLEALGVRDFPDDP